jgi:hypothetical protein
MTACETPELPELPALPERPALPELSPLTDEMIAEAIARTEKVASQPGDQRCLPLPYDVASALATCTP